MNFPTDLEIIIINITGLLRGVSLHFLSPIFDLWVFKGSKIVEQEKRYRNHGKMMFGYSVLYIEIVRLSFRISRIFPSLSYIKRILYNCRLVNCYSKNKSPVLMSCYLKKLLTIYYQINRSIARKKCCYHDNNISIIFYH